MNVKKLKQSKDFQENIIPLQTSGSKRQTFYESFQKSTAHQKQSSTARVQKLLISNEKIKTIKIGASPQIKKNSSVLKELKNNHNKTAIIEEDQFFQLTPNVKGQQVSNEKSPYNQNASPLQKKKAKQSSRQFLQQNVDEYFKETNKMKKKNKSLGNLFEKKKQQASTTTSNQIKSGQDLSFKQMAQYFTNMGLSNHNLTLTPSNNLSSINVKKIDLMQNKTSLNTEPTSSVTNRSKQQQQQQQSLNFKKLMEGEGQEFSRYFQNKQIETDDKTYLNKTHKQDKIKLMDRLKQKKKFKQFKKQCNKQTKALLRENSILKDQLHSQQIKLSSLQKLYSDSQKSNQILKLLLEFNTHLHLQDLSLIPPSTDSFILHSNDFQYFPDKVLGRGGFGEVYLGQLQGSKDVAVKILRINANEEQIKFLQGELMAMIICEHPNLVKLHGVCIESVKDQSNLNTQPINLSVFIIMELLITDLRKLVFKQSKIQLNKKQKYRILLDVLKGLEKLHALNYVHCDLKMQNILLDSKLNAKISDFGLSKKLGYGKTKQTITGFILLLFHYIIGGFSERNSAFEYLVEDKVSTKGDIWSFGILMYELMTQKVAWGNLTGRSHPYSLIIFQAQTVAKVSIQTPFYSCNSKIGDECDGIIENCLNYDHQKRPTAQTLIQQIQQLYDAQ